mmetsp:Transcript_42197/g.101920  ORF Transcript_42197/g.101920 Transcript_42197/m.101920 type:complete len:138 (-) Transcript_42197:15-428(-)
MIEVATLLCCRTPLPPHRGYTPPLPLITISTLFLRKKDDRCFSRFAERTLVVCSAFNAAFVLTEVEVRCYKEQKIKERKIKERKSRHWLKIKERRIMSCNNNKMWSTKMMTSKMTMFPSSRERLAPTMTSNELLHRC